LDRVKSVLSIGTTHPWNIAGVGLDVCVGSELGVRVLTVICAVTAQDAHGLHALAPVHPDAIDAQFAAIPWREIDSVRIGALGSADAVHCTYAALAARDIPVVLDPVIGASRGGLLAGDETVHILSHTLMTMPAAIVTPNVHEAERFLQRDIDASSIVAAAQELRQRGVRGVLLKGGHLEGDPIDVLATPGRAQTFASERIDGEMRGTGCVLALAMAASLAEGAPLEDAVAFGRHFVRTKIADAAQFGGLRVYPGVLQRR
jgi:hydroxymethylpyrimidine/phosphomethylpyrimidine kinase